MTFKYREVQISDDEAVGDSGTLTKDLNVREPITQLLLRFKVRNDTAVVRNHVPERHITKIEIVDGGQVYWSLPGRQAVAAAVRDLGNWPYHWYHETAAFDQKIMIPLLFGRYPGDVEFSLDPRKMLNPQLRITWEDETLYDDTFHTIGVTARVMEGAPAPAKCLTWREVEAWTTAASGVHKVDLPVDAPIRRMMIRGFAAATVLPAIFSNYKLDCDVGKFIAFDLASPEFVDLVKQFAKTVHQRQFVYASYNNTREAYMGEVVAIAGSAGNSKNYLYIWNSGASYFVCKMVENDGTVDETDTGQLNITGWFPHSCLVYPFGRPNDPETWFPARDYGEVALKITEVSASGEGSVCIQQPRSIP